nr:MAG: nonstructural protein [Microviridae sp.]
MAILNIYAIRDKKIGVYGKPFCETSDVQATRGLSIAVNDPTIQLSHFPDDFDLYKLGTFDEESGCILVDTQFVVGASSLQKLNQEVERVNTENDPSIALQPIIKKAFSNGSGKPNATTLRK